MAILSKHSADQGGSQSDKPAQEPSGSRVPGRNDDQPQSRALDVPANAPALTDQQPDSDFLQEPPVVNSSDAATQIDATPVLPEARDSGGQRILARGAFLGQRYEIAGLIGVGGVGAVYKATDRELNRTVALKVVRPDLAKDQSVVRRFKQELLLAREVTHKNVIRIYDLGECEGLRFITMELVEGEDLQTLLMRRKKLAVGEAVGIMQQVCRALEAAHGAGIIHRDLKPQNIMRNKNGRVLVMDFGLARTPEGEGMTRTGALVGTMEYMSPEQALGKELDQRSDLFAFGLIFYELLTGTMPYKAESAVASLIKRTREHAAPVITLDSSIPAALSNIVNKCLDPDRTVRYQTASEILFDLDAWQGGRADAISHFPESHRAWQKVVPWHWIGGIAAVLVLTLIGFFFRGRLFRRANQAPSTPAVSLTILPFRNASGDESINWIGPSLADMLSTDVGESAHLRVISPDRLQQVLSDLQVAPNATLDSTLLGRVAEFSGADNVLWGQYTKIGDQLEIDATIHKVKRNGAASLKAEAPTQKDLPATVDKLAESIRQNLDLSPDALKELKAQSFKPTSSSVVALRDYNQGLELTQRGKNLEAVNRLLAAVKEDPEFALAYSRLGETYAALGHDNEAEEAARRAAELSQQLPAAEKYRIDASYARIIKDNKKAIEAYENLAKNTPYNLDVLFALGGLYEDNADFDSARAYYTNVLRSDPNNLDALLAMGRVEIKAGNPERGLDPLNRALTRAIQLDTREQKALILQATGIAFRMMNKPDEAIRNYKESLELNRGLGQKRGAAASLEEIGEIQSSQGQPEAALASFNEALKIRRAIGAKKEAGDTLIDLGNLYQDRGQYDKALQMNKASLQIQRDAKDETYQALCLNNIASIYLTMREYQDAITYFQQALQLREKLNVPQDVAQTVSNLAIAYTSIGQFDQAMSSYMRALGLMRGAGDSHDAAFQSAGMALVFEYQGRYGAALTALQEAINTFHQTGDRSSGMFDFLAQYASVLAQTDRPSDARTTLDEAKVVARELKNESLIARTLNIEGDLLFYAGSWKAAKPIYLQALQTAMRGKSREQEVVSRLNLERVAISEGDLRGAVSKLADISQRGDSLGLKYFSILALTYRVEAMVDSKDFSRARPELRQVLSQAEKMGLRMQMAKIHYLQGISLRSSGQVVEAAAQYRQAVRLLDEMQNEPGATDLTHRFDLRNIYADAQHWAQHGDDSAAHPNGLRQK